MSVTKGWVCCPKCHRRIFRWSATGIEVAIGAKVMQPLDRRPSGEWVPQPDEVAIAQCPRGHLAAPPQGPIEP